MPSVYQTERPFSNLASGPKTGVHFTEPFVWTKKKVRQRRFKGRRITQL
ncbi:hypothetical protein ACVIWV_001954 [Bradyrhizobium diazoefficiens]